MASSTLLSYPPYATVSNSLNPTPGREEPDVFYIAVAALPETFERIEEWVALVVGEHAFMLGMRGVVDMSNLDPDRVPPANYVERLVEVLRPLMLAARNTRCAVIVPEGGLFWRARLFETLSSESRVQFRAFQRTADAMEWLNSK